MGKSWVRSAEQDKFLHEHAKELLKARLDESVKPFRQKLYESWEARWPEVKVIFPNRTDVDPSLTKEQMDELSNAMAIRKNVSLVLIPIVILNILFIATIYLHLLACRYKTHPHKKPKNFTRSLSSQGPGCQEQENDA